MKMMKGKNFIKGSLGLLLFVFLSFLVVGVPVNETFDSVNPSYHLIGGDAFNDNQSDFDVQNEVSVGLSDNLSSSNYSAFYSDSFNNYSSFLVDGYSFNQLSFSTTLHSFKQSFEGSITGSLDVVSFSDSYRGGYFDGSNDYVRIDNINAFDVVNGDFTACIVFNTSLTSGSTRGLFGRRDTGNGWELRYNYQELPQFYVRGSGNGSKYLTGSSYMNDNVLHVVCGRKNGGVFTLWVDGVVEDSEITGYSDMSVSNYVYIGRDQQGGSSLFEGTIKQVAFFNTSIDNSTMYLMGVEKSIFNLSDSSVVQIWFNHSLDLNETYFLMVDSDVSDVETVRVMGYNNMTSVNNSNFFDSSITSGISFIPLSSLVYSGYNYPFRVYDLLTSEGSDINNVYLFETVNDSVNPSVVGCVVNSSVVGCDESFRMSCNVSDNQAVFKTFFSYNLSWINSSVVEEANNLGGVYFVDVSSGVKTGVNSSFEWFLANASDVAGNLNETVLNLSVGYSCLWNVSDINIQHNFSVDQSNLTNSSVVIFWVTDNPSDSLVSYGLSVDNLSFSVFNVSDVVNHYVNLINLSVGTTYFYNITSSINPNQTVGVFNFTTVGCVELWSVVFGGCLINDSRFKYYVDNNSCGTFNNLPVDNGTFESCNYCSQNLEQVNGSCLVNNTLVSYWVDNNFLSCCSVTNIASDCNISFNPFNETSVFSCDFPLTEVVDDLNDEVNAIGNVVLWFFLLVFLIFLFLAGEVMDMLMLRLLTGLGFIGLALLIFNVSLYFMVLFTGLGLFMFIRASMRGT